MWAVNELLWDSPHLNTQFVFVLLFFVFVSFPLLETFLAGFAAFPPLRSISLSSYPPLQSFFLFLWLFSCFCFFNCSSFCGIWIFYSFRLSAWIFSDQKSSSLSHPKLSKNNQLVTGSLWSNRATFCPGPFVSFLPLLIAHFNSTLLHIHRVKQLLFWPHFGLVLISLLIE